MTLKVLHLLPGVYGHGNGSAWIEALHSGCGSDCKLEKRCSNIPMAGIHCTNVYDTDAVYQRFEESRINLRSAFKANNHLNSARNVSAPFSP